MYKEQEKLQHTFNEIRDLMKSRNIVFDDEEILELTEDDLYESQDDDILADDLYDFKTYRSEQSYNNQAEKATKSLETLKDLIKRVDNPIVDNNNNVTKAASENIKNVLEDWLNNNFSNIISKAIKKELATLIEKKEKDNV